VILVTSEMSRTPALNMANGKDHNEQTTSFLLAGGGLRGGRTIGGSRLISRAQNQSVLSAHLSRPFDFAAGRALSDAEILAIQQWPTHVRDLHSENVFAAVAELLGLGGAKSPVKAAAVKL
jgi:hypothetical protein